MIIGFTGTREGMTRDQCETLREWLARDFGEFHHGDCIGSDAQAHILADVLGWFTVVHPPLNERYRAWCDADRVLRAKNYLPRNRDIVKACELLIATPKESEEITRSGTWSTVRYARQYRCRVIIITPEGKTK